MQFNPEVITHPLLSSIVFHSTPSSFNWLTEFELFLNDLSLHDRMTILMPLILYARASYLREFTLESLKEMFS